MSDDDIDTPKPDADVLTDEVLLWEGMVWSPACFDF